MVVARHRWPEAERAELVSRLISTLRHVSTHEASRRTLLEAGLHRECVQLLRDPEYGHAGGGGSRTLLAPRGR